MGNLLGENQVFSFLPAEEIIRISASHLSAEGVND